MPNEWPCPDETAPSCPKCSDNTRFTVDTPTGSYCFCRACANVWFHEEPHPNLPSN